MHGDGVCSEPLGLDMWVIEITVHLTEHGMNCYIYELPKAMIAIIYALPKAMIAKKWNYP